MSKSAWKLALVDSERDMDRHYTTREFFRQMPNRLLARYFEAHGVLPELDMAATKETRINELSAGIAGGTA